MTSAVSIMQAAVADAGMSKVSAAQSLDEVDRHNAGKEFEAMFLRQTLESILPDSDNAVFGGGTAGGMWRSMLADRVSGVLAERGTLGLADMINQAGKDR